MAQTLPLVHLLPDGASRDVRLGGPIPSTGRDWELVRPLLDSYGVQIKPVVSDDAEWAARRWQRGEGLSLADRLCLALGERRDELVLTADTTWGGDGRIRQIR